MPDPHTTAEPFAEWCVVELMGRRRLAGYLQEVTIAGHGYLRLDIPAIGDNPGATQYLAHASVYAWHPVTEATAQECARAWRPAPVQRYELPAPPAPRPPADHDHDAWDEGDDPEVIL